jgi:hypothetical protein
MKRYALPNDINDGNNKKEKYPGHRIRCPVLVGGASQSLCMDPGHHSVHVLEGLVNVPAERKQLWLASTPGQGELQAKVAAW